MSIKNKKLDVNTKTLIYLIVFSITILLFLHVFQITFLNYFYERYKTNEIKGIASQISALKPAELSQGLHNIAYENNICIEHRSEYLTTKRYNNLIPGCVFNTNNRDLTNYQLQFAESKNKQSYIKIVDPEYNVKALLYNVKVDNGYVFLYTQLEDVNSTTIAIRAQLIYIILFAMLLSIIVAYFISRRISKPILEISQQAKKLGEGNYDLEFSPSELVEIEELKDALTYTSNELRKTDDIRRDLMANVSHDLKTPLTMIKAYAEMVKDFSHKNKEKMNDHLDIIISETDRLNVLVNDILNLSKMQNNADKLMLEEYDLVKETKNIIKKYEIIKEIENYQFIFEAPKECIVNADKNKLNQAIYNLINNAINYTGEDNKVTIRITELKKEYLIEIIDTGKGIDKKDIKHIWKKYYKNEKKHKRNLVGTGLGLSIVKEIFDKHNLNYGVESELNKGTTFYFKINKM